MEMNRRRFGHASLALLAPLAGSRALAQAGAGPIRFIIPYSPGTGSDTTARTVGVALGERLGRPVVVENRLGAASMIGTEAVVRSAPNGSTLLITTNTMVINRALYPKANFDPLKDLTPITMSGWTQMLLVASAQSGFRRTEDLIQAARRAPGKINYGSPGVGTLHHLVMELLKIRTRTSMLHIPFNGSGPAVTALLAGQVDAMFLPETFALAHIKTGRVVPLAIGSDKRQASVPDLPTLKEQGIADMNVPAWYGIYGPAGMPDDLVARLNAELRQILQSPEAREKLAAGGVEATSSTPAELRDLTVADAARWAQVVKVQGIRAE
ncbi:MAG TPA: tripartite tricarboxylate transporter substrate binding protein [Ramlibacter sp.]|jgi:tripartite-type tricarboxylate transporter receptor subunit TctC|nr:tripartite tricarboxylate transporter substrate binding protein [Ramlibacter sp.]